MKFRTHNKKKGAAVLITAAILALVFTACPQPGGGGATPPTPPAPPEIVYEFVAIPEATITGVDPDYTLPGTNNHWKGVFRAGRKVKLSPYRCKKRACN